MERMTFWSRVGDWIKNPRRSMGWDLSDRDSSHFAQVQSDVFHEGNGNSAETGNGERRPWLGFGGSRRHFEEQSRQLADLIKAVQAQSQRQTQATEAAVAGIDRLAAGLSTMPVLMKAQQEEIAALRKQLDQLPGGQKHVQDILSHLAGIRESVRDGSAALARHTELALKSSETIATELQRQNLAVTQLSQSTDPMMRAILALRADVGTKGDELAQCVATLNKKLLQFAVAALILAGVAAIIGIVALIRS